MNDTITLHKELCNKAFLLHKASTLRLTLFFLGFFLNKIGVFWLKSAIVNFRRFPTAAGGYFL